MANVKITELTAATALAGTDVLPIVDVGADATKKVSVSDLLRNLPDGTASAPALAFADDQNTGVLSPAANELAFATSGTQRLVIDSSGRLLLGTTTEGNALADNLTVADSGNCGLTLRSGTSNYGSIYFSDGTSGASEYRGQLEYNHSTDALSIYTAGSSAMRIDSSGRVGIGNTTMSSFTGNASDNLVVGSGSGGEGITVYSATNNQGSLTFADGTSGDAAYRGAVEYSHTNDRLAFRTAGTGNRMVIDSSGNVGVNTTSPRALVDFGPGSGDGTLSQTLSEYQAVFEAPQGTGDIGRNIAFAVTTGGITAAINATDEGGSNATGLTFATGNAGSIAERLRIDENGNVGIGTTSPAEKLHVVGDVRIVDNSPRLGFHDANASAIGDATGGVEIFNSSGSRSCFLGATEAAGVLSFGTNNSERMRIDSSGRVLIGATSGTELLEVHGDTPALKLRDTSSFAAGTGPSIAFQGNDSNAAIKQFSTIRGISQGANNGELAFDTRTGGSLFERMRIDSAGMVKIGTGSTVTPDANADDFVIDKGAADTGLSILSATTGRIYFGDAADDEAGSIRYVHSDNSMRFETASSERLRIDSSGMVDVKSGDLRVTGGEGLSASLYLIADEGDDNGDGWRLNSNQDDNDLTISSNVSGSYVDKVTVANNGDVLINTTSGLANGLICAAFDTSRNGMVLKPTNSTLNQNYLLFINSAGTTTGRIQQTATAATSYLTSSDYRLKENIVDLDGAITRVKQLAPKRFNFIGETDRTVDGFLAHEAQTVVPEAISGTHNGVEVWKEGQELPEGVSVGDNKLDEDGNTIPDYQGIDQSKLVPLLTAALQEAISKIETLEAKVAALEAQ